MPNYYRKTGSAISPLAISLIFLLNTGINAQTLNEKKQTIYSAAAMKIISKALSRDEGYKWLKELCAIGPRLSGSEGSIKAIYWAETKMKECGFDSVWLQPVSVPHWERGKTEEAVVSKSKHYKNRKLIIASYGGSIATPKEGITAEIVEVKSLDEARLLGDKAKGKIIFFNRPIDASTVNTFEGYGAAVDQRVEGAVEGAKVGAVAAIVRSVQTGYDDVPHTGSMHYKEGVEKIPGAAISVIDADFLSKAIKSDPGLEITIKMDCRTLPDAQSYNVIGQIKGGEEPDQVILVGGHIDCWDKGVGAHDDGAPSIQCIEAVDLLKQCGLKPKRTIRTVLFINEENGLRGGIAYGKYAASAKESHLAAIESDRGAFTPRGFSVTSDSSTLLKMESWLPVLNYAYIDWIRKGGSGADVGAIKNAKALIGYVPDDQRYMDLHHSANDTFDKVHPREMELGSAAIAILVYLISEEGL